MCVWVYVCGLRKCYWYTLWIRNAYQSISIYINLYQSISIYINFSLSLSLSSYQSISIVVLYQSSQCLWWTGPRRLFPQQFPRSRAATSPTCWFQPKSARTALVWYPILESGHWQSESWPWKVRGDLKKIGRWIRDDLWLIHGWHSRFSWTIYRWSMDYSWLVFQCFPM